MRMRLHAGSAIGVTLLAAGSFVLLSLILNRSGIELRLSHWKWASGFDVVTACSAAGWLFLLSGFLLLAPAHWFRWLEKP